MQILPTKITEEKRENPSSGLQKFSIQGNRCFSLVRAHVPLVFALLVKGLSNWEVREEHKSGRLTRKYLMRMRTVLSLSAHIQLCLCRDEVLLPYVIWNPWSQLLCGPCNVVSAEYWTASKTPLTEPNLHPWLSSLLSFVFHLFSVTLWFWSWVCLTFSSPWVREILHSGSLYTQTPVACLNQQRRKQTTRSRPSRRAGKRRTWGEKRSFPKSSHTDRDIWDGRERRVLKRASGRTVMYSLQSIFDLF